MARPRKKKSSAEGTAKSSPTSQGSETNSCHSPAGSNKSTPQTSHRPSSSSKRRKKKSNNMTTKRFDRTKYGPNASGSGRDTRTAKLELPDGYIPPKSNQEVDKPKNNNNNKKYNNQKGKNADKKMDPLPAKDPYDRLLPWSLGIPFPKPNPNAHPEQDRKAKPPPRAPCVFNYKRFWLSLGSNPGKQIRKAFTKWELGKLRQPSTDMTNEELEALHKVYWEAGKGTLFKRRKAVAAKGISPKVFDIFLMAEASGNPVKNRNVLLLSTVLSIAEIRKMIIDYLMPSISDVTALASTCKLAASLMKADFDIWDFRCNDLLRNDQFVIDGIKDGGRHENATRSNTLVIVDRSKETLSHGPVISDFYRFVKLCGAISTIPMSFRSIIIDRIPFFNVTMFEMMLRTMPNLEEITVIRCLMLDVCRLPRMLRAIRDNRRDHSHHINNGYVLLDFYPFFFRGPTTGERLGTFGVTWHEPTFDIPRAVIALIHRCWDIAEQVGMDLLGSSSAFWRFISQLPGPDALWALKAREAFVTYHHNLQRHNKQGVNPQVLAKIRNAFSTDLTAAVTGDNQSHPWMPPLMQWRIDPAKTQYSGAYWNNWDHCPVCNVAYPRSLFPLRLDCCWGCKMSKFITDMEDSHLRLWQEAIICEWSRGLGSDAYIPDLIANEEHLVKAAAMARAADEIAKAALLGQFTEKLMPMPAPFLDDWRAGIHRLKFYIKPLTQPVDLYRKGGPQHEHPGKRPPSCYMIDDDFAPLSPESFYRCWQWSTFTDTVWEKVKHKYEELLPEDWPKGMANTNYELRRIRGYTPMHRIIREEELKLRNEGYKTTFRYARPRAEDCIWSLTTPDSRPYNLDQPVPDPYLNPEEHYQRRVEQNWVITEDWDQGRV